VEAGDVEKNNDKGVCLPFTQKNVEALETSEEVNIQDIKTLRGGVFVCLGNIGEAPPIKYLQGI